MPHIPIILLRVIWVGLVIVSAVMTLLMFAFADSPGAGKVAARMVAPAFIGAFIAYCIGAALIGRSGIWWHFVIAYALAILPPPMVMLGYKLFM